MHADTTKHNEAQAPSDRAIGELPTEQIDRTLPEGANEVRLERLK